MPGDKVSCYHYISPVPGRVVSSSGRSSSAHGYVAGTIYVDHASGWIFHRPQKSIAASDTIRGKLLLEREATEVNTKIKSYHSDNGVFNSDEFRQHCDQLDQTQTFSGVGAKFQNGVAERSILTICSMARANMLHAALHWPGMKFLNFWPMAMSYAIWIYNQLPQKSSGLSPEELWSRNKSAQTNLKRAHVFGCPVYVLHPKLQDGKSIPKWDAKARQGVFVGYSTEHSSTVALVYNTLPPNTFHPSTTSSLTMPSLQFQPSRLKLKETRSLSSYMQQRHASTTLMLLMQTQGELFQATIGIGTYQLLRLQRELSSQRELQYQREVSFQREPTFQKIIQMVLQSE